MASQQAHHDFAMANEAFQAVRTPLAGPNERVVPCPDAATAAVAAAAANTSSSTARTRSLVSCWCVLIIRCLPHPIVVLEFRKDTVSCYKSAV